MPEERKPEKRTIKEIVEEAKKTKRLPELVESLAKEIKKAKMSKEEIREIYQEIPKEKIEEYKKIAKEIGIGHTSETIVVLYSQEKTREQVKIEDEFIKTVENLFKEKNLSPPTEQVEIFAKVLQTYGKSETIKEKVLFSLKVVLNQFKSNEDLRKISEWLSSDIFVNFISSYEEKENTDGIVIIHPFILNKMG